MRISVLFCSYNQKDFVREALAGAFAQDYPEYELVVADDGSCDGTRQVIDEVIREAPAHVRVIRADGLVNQGLVASFTRAVEASTGEILVPMAGDDVSESNRLRLLADVFHARPDVRLVCSNVRKIDASGRRLPDARFLPEGDCEYAYPPGGPTGSLYAGLPMVGATAAYRRSLFDVFGPLGPDAPGEDNCLAVRALLLGPAIYLGDRLVRWRRHDGNLSTHEFDTATISRAQDRHLEEYSRAYRNALQIEADLLAPSLASHVSPGLLLSVGACARRHGARQLLRHRSLKPASWADWSAAVGRLDWRDRLTAAPLMFLRWALPPCRWLYWQLLARKLNRTT